MKGSWMINDELNKWKKRIKMSESQYIQQRSTGYNSKTMKNWKVEFSNKEILHTHASIDSVTFCQRRRFFTNLLPSKDNYKGLKFPHNHNLKISIKLCRVNRTIINYWNAFIFYNIRKKPFYISKYFDINVLDS